jgi:hypothetical protein
MSYRRLLKYRNGPRCCSILVLAKARVQHRYPQRSRPSEQRRPAPKSTQPSGREAEGASGGVARVRYSPLKGMRLTRFLPSAPSASTRDPFWYLNSLLNGPDLSQDSAEVSAEDQLDVCIRIAPANQTISDVKHTLIMIHAIGVHFIAESVTGFIEAP